MSFTKFLILDIDGVANCHTTKERFRGMLGIDPAKAALIKDILAKTGAELILCSTWRMDDPHFGEVVRQIGKVKGQTPILREDRGSEILHWLKGHVSGEDTFAILDDDIVVGGYPELKPHWFQTDFYGEGLTRGIADKVIAHLNRE